MKFSRYQKRFEENGRAVCNLVQGVCSNQAVWKPTPQKWSVLEIMMHLWDEEREDFKVRLDYLLHHPEKPWPPIDPEGWVVSREYNTKGLAAAVMGFAEERAKSVAWLGTLGADLNLTAEYEHPRGWRVSAGDMLASWAAHDLLHLRQLTHTMYLYEKEAALPFKTEYAGRWPGESA